MKYLCILALLIFGSITHAEDDMLFNAWPELNDVNARTLSPAQFAKLAKQSRTRREARDAKLTELAMDALRLVEVQVLVREADDDFTPAVRPKARAHRLACLDGDGRRCLELAELYRLGIGTWIDRDLATAMFELGCYRGVMEGCHKIDPLFGPFRLDVDDARAALVPVLVSACDLGDGIACDALADRAEKLYMRHSDPRALKEMRDLKSRSRRLSRAACASGDGANCHATYLFALSDNYSLATGLARDEETQPPDWDDVVRNLETGCDQFHADSCASLASVLKEGKFVTADVERARVYKERACNLGKAWACRNTGRASEVSQAPVVCGSGSPEACLETLPNPHRDLATSWNDARARMAENRAGGSVFEALVKPEYFLFPPETHGAVRRTARACASGQNAACATLAGFYDDRAGRGFDWGHFDGIGDRETRGAIFEGLCATGYFPACTHFGDMHSGRGSRSRPDLFLPAWQRGCDNGEGASCDRLGMEFELGRNVGTDEHEAIKLFRRACDLGEVSGCRHLAGYTDGDAEIYAAANLRACLEDGSGCSILAQEYDQGSDGFRRDRSLANRIRKFPCDLGAYEYCN
ncbi:hypothetical protein [uncultured Tateyamaria sp.]|uniref:tetratricopeptide repeat protein n=1 Tax=uncultured Tateyamaria sp. TaxID=455651 RepID=UPI00260CA191|nr:hypothetical protein [uncultured Tateyamaria sp.]